VCCGCTCFAVSAVQLCRQQCVADVLALRSLLYNNYVDNSVLRMYLLCGLCCTTTTSTTQVDRGVWCFHVCIVCNRFALVWSALFAPVSTFALRSCACRHLRGQETADAVCMCMCVLCICMCACCLWCIDMGFYAFMYIYIICTYISISTYICTYMDILYRYLDICI
jgi:hypothetical protein